MFLKNSLQRPQHVGHRCVLAAFTGDKGKYIKNAANHAVALSSKLHVNLTIPGTIGLELDDEAEAHAVRMGEGTGDGIVGAHKFVALATRSEGGSHDEHGKVSEDSEC